MKRENQQWDFIRNDYLSKIQEALQGAADYERRQILDEVAVHLDQRFDELSVEEQTWENMQAIITEMGPVEDYAALLEEKPLKITPKHRSPLLWILGTILFIALLIPLCDMSYPLLKKYQQSKRPVVVQTTPAVLDMAVNPDMTEISVTFDQPMMNFSWSWVGGGEHYPETTGEPHYDKDCMTCSLPVKLQPGHWYWIGINSQKYVYFQTEQHIPARRYVILFATADENGNPTQIPDDYIEEAKRINSQ
jgi:hypothetical protein